jgi:mRNA interferase MazF
MTNYKFGDVILVPFPFTDQTTTKKRPAVVISSGAYNSTKADLIMMPITSQAGMVVMMGEVLVGEWKKAGLIEESIVKPIIATIERKLVIKKLGKLEEEDLQAVKEILQQILG